MRYLRWCRISRALILLIFPCVGMAWSDHALCTWQALEGMRSLPRQPVAAEGFEHFLLATTPQLTAVLDAEERWARNNLQSYAPRPDHFRFRVPNAKSKSEKESLKQDFLRAIRVNEASPVALFVQYRPGTDVPLARHMDGQEVSLLKGGFSNEQNHFVRLTDGQAVLPIDIVATASEEPDYGMDLGLWDDNGTTQGRQAGFGPQPFGNPRFEYSSQAPFHMGFYHEADIVYQAASFLKRTYPEARTHLYLSLAQFAFANGHPYWGWRFTGWAVHYVQDLSQPYHARVLPGVSVTRMLWINVLDQVGIHSPKRDAINLVANRHTVLENYQSSRMKEAYKNGDRQDTLLVALRDTNQDKSHWRFDATSIRQIVSAESAAAADSLDAQLERSFPAKYTSDPDENIANDMSMNMYKVATQFSVAENSKLSDLLVQRMRQLGRDTRAVIRASLCATESMLACPEKVH